MDTRTVTPGSAGAGARRPARICAVNDFVVKFANVHGSGSASANELVPHVWPRRERRDEISGFALEPRAAFAVRRRLVGQEPERHIPFEAAVASAIHVPIPPAPWRAAIS